MSDQFSFPEAKQKRAAYPQEPIIRTAEIEGNYRWVLKRAWGAGPCILWCGLNPSTADGQRDDPTMRREIGFSYRWGFGSLIKVNVYPFISANQHALRKWRGNFRPQENPNRDASFFEMHRSAFNAWICNLDTVTEQIQNCSKHVAAWGNGADSDDLKEFLENIGLDVASEHDGFGIVRVPIDWYCLGKNADGSPVHPLARGRNRIPDDAALQPWRTT